MAPSSRACGRFLRASFLCLVLLHLLLACTTPLPVSGQDRQTLTDICTHYNRSIRIAVLNKGETGFPMTAWSGIFVTWASTFLKNFGCSTEMTLYSFAPLLAAVADGLADFIFCNPLQGTQFEVQYGATPLVSLTMTYTVRSDLLPFPGVTASLYEFGAIMMYMNANATKNSSGLVGGVPSWVQERRALIDTFNVTTWDGLISLASHFPPRNLTLCAVSETSLGGWQMANYEFQKRRVVTTFLFSIYFANTHDASIDAMMDGMCDFATARTGTIDVFVNTSLLELGTFVVLDNAPTEYFPLYISTPLYPEWLVMTMPSVPTQLAQAFTVPLTALSILTTTPEALAVSDASFSYPFSYSSVMSLMYDLNVLGTGECAAGYGRRQFNDPWVVNASEVTPCFQCQSGEYSLVANNTATCTPCPFDTYSIVPGNNCTACDSGYVTQQEGAASCMTAPRPVIGIAEADSLGVVVGCCICILLLACISASVIALRRHPVMKASSPLFLLFALAGLMMMCASVIPRARENVGLTSLTTSRTGAVCLADQWLVNLGYTLVTGALLVKTWRLYNIFSVKQLAGRKTLSDARLTVLLFVILLIKAAIIFGITEAVPLSLQLEQLNSTEDYWVCSTPASSPYSIASLYFPVMLIPRFVLLIATTVAAFLVRHLPSAFNESSQLLYTMYNLCFFSALLTVIDATIGRGKSTGLLAYGASMYLICLLCAAMVFIPKFYLIFRGKTKVSTGGGGSDNGLHETLLRTSPTLMGANSSRSPPRSQSPPPLPIMSRRGTAMSISNNPAAANRTLYVCSSCGKTETPSVPPLPPVVGAGSPLGTELSVMPGSSAMPAITSTRDRSLSRHPQ